MVTLTPAVRDQVNRILAGRPPNPDQASLNKAIEYINENPGLRRIAEGGAPTGLTEERKEAFKIQEARRLDIELGDREREAQRLGVQLKKKEEPTTVMVGGQGFSVRPEEQQRFIEEEVARRQQAQQVQEEIPMSRRGVDPTDPSTFREPDLFDAVGQDSIFGAGVGLFKKPIEIPIFVGAGGRVPISRGKLKEELGTTGEVFGTILPTTYGEAVLFGAIPLGVSKIPKIARIGVGSGIGVFEGRRVFDPTLTKGQRISSGIFAGLGTTGAVFEGVPFLRGAYFRTKPTFRGVKTQPEGFKGVGTGKDTIGLILEKAPLKAGKTTDVLLPKISPLVRGGFGVKESQKGLFLGKEQQLATSQVGFFREGKSIKLEREFFTTPQEPFIKIPETRVSRLGLGAGLLEFPKETQIGFGIPKTSQIGLTLGDVTRTGKGGSFRIGTGTELEAIKGAGAVITDVKKVGVTTIRGEGVEIFRFRVGKGKGVPGKDTKLRTPTTKGVTRVAGETTLASLGASRLLTTRRQPTLKTPPVTRLTPPETTTGRPTTTTTTGRPTTTTAPSITRGITTPITLKSLTTTAGSPLFSPLTLPKTTTSGFRDLKPRQAPKRQARTFTTFVRRGGVFRPVATSKDLQRAISIGRDVVGRTLGATFRVSGVGALRTPKGFRAKQEREGIVFIEKPRYRLSTGGEIREIQRARKKKKKKKS